MREFLKCYPKSILFQRFTDTQTKDNVSSTQHKLQYNAGVAVIMVLQRVFFTFLNCANGTKSRNASQQMQMKLVKVTIHSVHLPVSAARR